jgi:hypothetical protein
MTNTSGFKKQKLQQIVWYNNKQTSSKKQRLEEQKLGFFWDFRIKLPYKGARMQQW